MNKEEFFQHYPFRKKEDNKYTHGRVLFISGSYGMAGAAILNLIGSGSTGVSYIHSVLPSSIYPIVACRQITTVFHPDPCDNADYLKDLQLLAKVDAISIGSGLDHHPFRKEYLKDVLQDAKVPVIVDACGLTMLSEDETLYSAHPQMVLTPHMGEFCRLSHLCLEEIARNKEEIALAFAKEKQVTLVLKGPETIIVSKEGKLIKNDSGNEALARAGSGDVLTGMITGLSALYEDKFQAVCDAVWLHGFLADQAIKKHSKEIFDLTAYVEYADEFFFQR